MSQRSLLLRAFQSLNPTPRKSQGRRRRKPVATIARQLDRLEVRTLLTGNPFIQFDFAVIASNPSDSLGTIFMSSNPADAPYTEINFGEVQFITLSGLPDASSAVSQASDLTLHFGSTNSLADPVLTLSDFDDGTTDGEANQIFTHQAFGSENRVELRNNGVPVAEGALLSVEIRTNPSRESRAFGQVVFTDAIGFALTGGRMGLAILKANPEKIAGDNRSYVGPFFPHPEQIGRPLTRGTISTWITAGVPSTSRISARW